jgi:hypothetical protein
MALSSKAIKENAADISLVSSTSTNKKFCEIWPSVKSGLQILQGIVKNPIAKATIGIVIATGDAVAGRIC